jgi:predicted nucleotidyltransferase component of viral defense system
MTGEAKTYKTAGAFRTALETRLQGRAREEGTDLQRLRRQVAFDRFLARLFSKGPKAVYPWVLKGGYAMELRTHTARTTKDIDLTLHDSTRLSKDPKERREQIRAMLQEAAATSFGDFFEFLVGEAREDLEGAPGGGSRYPVEARMDGRNFARFHVDIGIGDEVLEPLDIVTGEDWLGFGGVKPPSFPIISAEQQFAEKLHAYALPRGERMNTRTKDLIDMILLIREEELDQEKTTAAVRATFLKRATHDLPKEIDPPPAEWEPVFDALAKECDLNIKLLVGFEMVREFTRALRSSRRESGETR